MKGYREIRMIDLEECDRVEFCVDNQGKVWVNVDEVCLLRIGHAKAIKFDSMMKGSLVNRLIEAKKDENKRPNEKNVREDVEAIAKAQTQS